MVKIIKIKTMKPHGYNPFQASKELGLDKKTLYRWVKEGLVKSTRLPNGRYCISAEELERLKGVLSGERESQPSP